MRASAGFDAGNAIRRQRSRAHQEFGVPFGVDVVGDRGDVVALAHRLAEQVHQRGLSRADRTSDADTKRAVRTSHLNRPPVFVVPAKRAKRALSRDPYRVIYL